MKYVSSMLGVTALIAVGAAGAPASAQVMDEVKERGTLRVGVKADYRPYGYLNEEGDIVGMEPDLAQDVADKMGVDLEMTPVVASNRMQFLNQGRIDLMIATMTNTEERAEVVNIVEPNYYSSGVNVLAPKSAGLSEWGDLDGAPVCGLQGAFYNRMTEQDYGAEIDAFTGTAEALTALEQGRCIAFVYDDSFITSRLSEDLWSADYEMPFKSIDNSPWGLAVAKGEDEFAEYMSETVKEWHASGRILELEDKYGIPNIEFTQEMNKKYSAESN